MIYSQAATLMVKLPIIYLIDLSIGLKNVVNCVHHKLSKVTLSYPNQQIQMQKYLTMAYI